MIKLQDRVFERFLRRFKESASVSFAEKVGGIKNPVPISLYFLLNDTEDYLLKEVDYYNGKKPFMKELRKDKFTISSLVALESLSTHLSIGYIKRLESRVDVNNAFYMRLRQSISDVVEAIIHRGEVVNPYYTIFVDPWDECKGDECIK